MRVTEIVPASGDAFDVGTAEGEAALASRYDVGRGAFVRLNMITSVTGAAVGGDGTSNTLTSRTDRAVLGLIRRGSDVVVVGAATVRAEGYLLPRAARLAVVTTSGDLTGHRFPEAPGAVLLVCPADRVDAVRERSGLSSAEIVGVTGGDELRPQAIVAALRSRGLERIVCEGGPTLAARFADAGVIDEYCVTVAPVLEPAPRAFLPIRRAAATAVAGMLVDEDGFSYLRLRPRG
ncbi:dihydrofolate reductase family protein [Microbacterium sp. RD1]|uniref:dihydrofolate reductase family protein n=1 Tax=Microbacterium sp. RD1 TaxID=3457313 RepID=UPI003FA5CF10